MDNLRLFLILIGLVVLALIWWLHKPDGSRRPGASRREIRRQEPGLGSKSGETSAESRASGDWESELESRSEPEQASLPDFVTAPAESADGRREPVLREPVRDVPGNQKKSGPSPNPSPDPAPNPELSVPPEDQWCETESVRNQARSAAIAGDLSGDDLPKIVTLYVRARGNRKLSGLSLLDSAIKAGLRFGEMKIFHRRHQGATRPVFSMANITRPGSFDPSGWNLFETPGVTLFMTLPGPVSALDAWDAMLATGQRLAELLDADLMDDSQCLLTRQRISQIREDMRTFDRKAGQSG
ncbi:MAG: cell division protein ZipA [Wenzhouxiangellaceae bacterium]|nr:cell division protein ZipA [Wenzhouxiangellaceae bacterium]